MFANRQEAGKLLAQELQRLDLINPMVLGMVRGGLPVAWEIAKVLQIPLDIVLVRKLGAPQQPELAIGAVVDGPPPALVLNEELIQRLGVEQAYIEGLKQKKLQEIEQRRKLYCGDRKPVPVKGRSVILVDDGIATGASARAALQALHQSQPKEIILAVPVAASEVLLQLRSLVDQIICLDAPYDFSSVGAYYSDFHQVEDEEVINLLHQSQKLQKAS